MNDRTLSRYQLQVIHESHADLGELVRQFGALQASLDADQDGRAHGAEGDWRALDHHSDHDGSHGRKAHRHHKGSTDGSRRTETGGPLDEGAEEPSYQYQLHPTVGADVGESGTDGGNGTRMFEGIEQKDGTENNVQNVDRQKQPLDCGGHEAHRINLPENDCDNHSHIVADGHGPFGGPTETDQQHGSSQYG